MRVWAPAGVTTSRPAGSRPAGLARPPSGGGGTLLVLVATALMITVFFLMWFDGHAGHVPAGAGRGADPGVVRRTGQGGIGKTWVAAAGGAVAGFVVVVDDEVEQVHVDRSWRGLGVAERLLRRAEAVIGQDCHAPPGWPSWRATPGPDGSTPDWAGATGAPSPTRRRRRPARSRSPPTGTSARWATVEPHNRAGGAPHQNPAMGASRRT
jgi:GNAT superfamily N-acetyltransferase